MDIPCGMKVKQLEWCSLGNAYYDKLSNDHYHIEGVNGFSEKFTLTKNYCCGDILDLGTFNNFDKVKKKAQEDFENYIFTLIEINH